MIQSMTGYGKATGKMGGNSVTVEIKSLNGKSFELGLRIPLSCREKELEIRNLLSQEIQRGRAEASILIDNGNDSKKGSLNKKFIRSFIHELKLLERELKLPHADYLNTVLALPNAMGS
ncbi:MAG: YicC/YloC family endoribonuclease, partial [Bacteroidia bacterium]